MQIFVKEKNRDFSQIPKQKNKPFLISRVGYFFIKYGLNHK